MVGWTPTLPENRLRLKGWPRGWKQYKTRTRLILVGPGKNPLKWEWVLKFYPFMKDGLSLDKFVEIQRMDLIEASAHYQKVMKKLGLGIPPVQG